MRYVGYSEYFHDAGIAVIEEDGTISYATQSERYSKIKNDPLIPDSLWDSVVQKNDKICYYQDPDLQHESNEIGSFEASVLDEKFKYIFNPGSIVYDNFNLHHVSHVAQGYYTRPWESKKNTVMVSIDGCGEYQSIVVYDSDFNVLKEYLWPCSLGSYYAECTAKLGYKKLQDEYIVMGMSAYGEVSPEHLKILNDHWDMMTSIPTEKEKRELAQYAWLEREDFSEEGITQNTRLMGKRMQWSWKNKFNNLKDEDIAATIQKFTEDKIIEIMKFARKHGNKLIYSGGVAQNIVANSLIKDIFDDVHIAIAPADSGSSIGTAAKTWSDETGGDKLTWSPYLGYDIKKDINPKDVVDYLIKNKVCGVANGKAEFGPRALGNRSLLGDVRYDIKDTVNKIKKRELFRPFAPAILEEYADEYFDGHKNEYMQYTCNAKHDYKSVIHVDGTSRCQVVKKDCQSVIRPILEEYYERTGVPMLLNTSLNIKGQPILNDEQDVEEWEKKYKVRIF